MKEIDMNQEIWKEIKCSPGYFVSNYGRVKSYKQDKINGKLRKGQIDSKGYIVLRLPNIYEKKVKCVRINRLVAEAFISNPKNKPEVNHIDEDKTNNRADNLEWMTRKENCNHGTRNGRIAKTKGKKVKCVETGEVYYSTLEAKRQTGIANTGAAASGIYSHAGGFHWEYAD